MKRIVSTENPLIKEIIKIKKDPINKVLIEGMKLISMVLGQKDLKIEKILVTENFITKNEDFIKNLSYKNTKLIIITQKIANKISETVTPQGIFALVDFKIRNISEWKFKKVETIAILDRIQDPGNMGTIIRTAEAFGVDAIILTPDTCNPLSSKVIRASAGSIFFIPILKAKISEIYNFIKKHRLKLVITKPAAEEFISEIELNPPLAVVFGNEAHGVGEYFEELSDLKCKIPQIGRAESLNVAISASIILYEIMKRKIKNYQGKK